MSEDAYQTPPFSNKRVNSESGPDEYPRKSFKVGKMDSTPFHQQPSRDAFSTPSTGRTLTPCSPKLSGKRDQLHRLRQQLKNRDEMIMEMQSQILEQGRVIHMHELRMGDLELLLQSKNKSLLAAEQKVDCLRRLVAESCTCRAEQCRVRKKACSGVNNAVPDVRKQRLNHQHNYLEALVSEARRLTEELKLAGASRLQREREYHQKLRLAEAELSETRSLAGRNASLLEACERERALLSGVLTELQQKLENQAIKLEQIRACKTPAGAKQDESENTITSAPLETSSSSRELRFSSESSGVLKPNNSSLCRLQASNRAVDFMLLSMQQDVDNLQSEVSSFTRCGTDDDEAMQAKVEELKKIVHLLLDKLNELGGDSVEFKQCIEQGRRYDADVMQLSVDMEQVMLEEKMPSPGKCKAPADARNSFGTFEQVMVEEKKPSPGKCKGAADARNSFGTFVFDIEEEENGAMVIDENYTRAAAVHLPDSSLSPFSKMMSKLDLLHHHSPAASFTDSVIVAEKIERSISSLDSAFDRILDNTLEDMVRICSPEKLTFS